MFMGQSRSRALGGWNSGLRDRVFDHERQSRQREGRSLNCSVSSGSMHRLSVRLEREFYSRTMISAITFLPSPSSSAAKHRPDRWTREGRRFSDRRYSLRQCLSRTMIVGLWRSFCVGKDRLLGRSCGRDIRLGWNDAAVAHNCATPMAVENVSCGQRTIDIGERHNNIPGHLSILGQWELEGRTQQVRGEPQAPRDVQSCSEGTRSPSRSPKRKALQRDEVGHIFHNRVYHHTRTVDIRTLVKTRLLAM